MFDPVPVTVIIAALPATPTVTLPPEVAIFTLDVPFEIDERSRPIILPAAIFEIP